MARWEGNARGRLEQAALDLFDEQGYDRTTVAQIAQRANLTERSFYRWFADKREALFGGGDELEQHLVAAIEAVPAETGALSTLLAAFPSVTEVIRTREFLRTRSAVIAANPPLRERELIKLASLSEAVTDALLRRGCDRRTARLATDIGMALFRSASDRWMADEHADPATIMSSITADLRTVTAEGLASLAPDQSAVEPA